MTHIIYSAQRSGFESGQVYENPKFFNGVVNKVATSVTVIGDWPDVVTAYKKAGVEVRSEFLKQSPQSGDSDGDDDGDDGIDLPDDWESKGFKTLARYAKKFDPDARVKNKEEAVEFIKAHLPPAE